MGFTEKITSAKKSTWLSEGFSEAEIKTTVSYRITCNNGNQRTLINP